MGSQDCPVRLGMLVCMPRDPTLRITRDCPDRVGMLVCMPRVWTTAMAVWTTATAVTVVQTAVLTTVTAVKVVQIRWALCPMHGRSCHRFLSHVTQMHGVRLYFVLGTWLDLKSSGRSWFPTLVVIGSGKYSPRFLFACSPVNSRCGARHLYLRPARVNLGSTGANLRLET